MGEIFNKISTGYFWFFLITGLLEPEVNLINNPFLFISFKWNPKTSVYLVFDNITQGFIFGKSRFAINSTGTCFSHGPSLLTRARTPIVVLSSVPFLSNAATHMVFRIQNQLENANASWRSQISLFHNGACFDIFLLIQKSEKRQITNLELIEIHVTLIKVATMDFFK